MSKFTPVVDKVGKRIPFLFWKEGSPFIYVRKTFKRYRIRPLFESTKEKTVGRARAKADELVNSHLNRYFGGTDLKAKRFNAISIGAVIDEINRVQTPTLRVRTQEHRHLYFKELKKELGTVDVTRMDADRWSQWLAGFRKRKNRLTYWDYAKHMKIILGYAYERKYITHKVKLPKPDTVTPEEVRVFTQDEIDRLYQHMNEDTRDQFVLSYENYMRLREVLYLRWDCVDLESGLVRLKASDVKTGSKTKKGREFILSQLALERLQVRRSRVKGPYVFPSKENPWKPVQQNITAWRAAKRRAKIFGKAKWHSLRHTAISNAVLKHDVGIVHVSEFAGVSVATIQKVYLHSTAQQTARAGQVLRISVPVGCDKGVTKEQS